MMIKNREELVSHGNVEGREVILDVVERALSEVNSYNLVKRAVSLRGNRLRIGPIAYDLANVRNVYVLGCGKQVTFMVAALEEVLGDRIADGIAIEKRGWGCKTRRLPVVEGGHPLPDEKSVEGAERMIELARRAGRDDLVIVCVTGGCTALSMLPPEGVSLEDVRVVTDLLLRSGAPIEEVNAVRKHLSRTGGGKLALEIHPAQVVGLIVVDEVGGRPWGPTVPDTTTFADAVMVLKKYDLWSKVPESVRKFLERGDPREETPKERDFERLGVRVHNLVLADNNMLCESAKKRARELGLSSEILSTFVEGEAKDVGVVLASIAREIESRARPLRPPCVLVAGGETTVTITGEAGEGGRNQELALSAALKIKGSRSVVIASIGTDGSDGPTDIAGAIVDGYTAERAEALGIDLFEELKRHNSSYVFRSLGDAVYTNPTGTNLMDLMLVYVGEREGLD